MSGNAGYFKITCFTTKSPISFAVDLPINRPNMENRVISFEALPQVTSELQAEVRDLRETLEMFMNKVLEIKPEQPNDLVGIDEACRILGLKKPTLYHKAQRKEIPSYKPAGCKMPCSNALTLWHGLSVAARQAQPALQTLKR